MRLTLLAALQRLPSESKVCTKALGIGVYFGSKSFCIWLREVKVHTKSVFEPLCCRAGPARWCGDGEPPGGSGARRPPSCLVPGCIWNAFLGIHFSALLTTVVSLPRFGSYFTFLSSGLLVT